MSSLMVCAIWIMGWAREMAGDALCIGVHWLFVIAHSHYENIDLETMS